MAHTGIFATKAEIDTKVGENVDATGYIEAAINAVCLQVENYINCATRYNWSDVFASLNVDVKYILSETASNLVAIYFINYNMSGFTSRTEAEIMLNVLKLRADECIAILSDKNVQTFMIGA